MYLCLTGVPTKEFKEFMENYNFNVILVMPGHIIWLIDTLPGLIFLLLLLLAFIALVIGLVLYCCKRAGVCCFKPK